MLTEDSLRYAEARPPTGVEKVMAALSEALAPHLRGAAAEDHIEAEVAFHAGRVRILVAATTPDGERALRRLSEE